MNYLKWILENSKFVLITAAILIIVAAIGLYYADQNGYRRHAQEQLAIKPDTTHELSAPIVVPPVVNTVQAKKTPLTVDYKAKIDSVVNAVKDSMKQAYAASLEPIQAVVEDSASVRVNSTLEVYVPFIAYIDVDKITDKVKLVLQLTDFRMPVEKITNYVPIEVQKSILEIGGWIAVGAVIATIFFWAVGLL